jgi:hypothetical protein
LLASERKLVKQTEEGERVLAAARRVPRESVRAA